MNEVSRRAAEERIRRALARDCESLHKCNANSQWYRDLGDYYTADCQNHLNRTHCTLEQLAEELRVLAPNERIAA